MVLPFLPITIILAGGPDPEDDTKTVPDKEVEMLIQPSSITAIQPGYFWGAFIYFSGSQVVCTQLDVEQIQEKLAQYWEEVHKKMGYKQSGIVKLR